MERFAIRHRPSPNFREVLARHNQVGTTNERGKEPIEHFQVHCALTAESLKYISNLLAFVGGELSAEHWHCIPPVGRSRLAHATTRRRLPNPLVHNYFLAPTHSCIDRSLRLRCAGEGA